MTRLDTVRVSRASADQRRGRAGRSSPGVCYRLWPEYENAHLLVSTPPEISSADLAPLALDLAAAGVCDPFELRWLDPPTSAAFNQAVELLRELDAVDESGAITPHGREMSALPVHPRLAHMLRRARAIGATSLASACFWAIEGDVSAETFPCPTATFASRPRARWYRVSRAAASACMSSAPTSGSSRPRMTTMPSAS